MAADELLFRKTYKYMVYGQRLNWIDPALPDHVRTRITRFAIFTTNLFCCFLLWYSVVYHDIMEDDLTLAFKNSFMMMVSIIVGYKYNVLITHQKNVNTIKNNMNREYRNIDTLSRNNRRAVIQNVEKSVWICKIWFVLSLATSVLFPLKAACLMLHSWYKGAFKLYMILPLHLPPFFQFGLELPEFVAMFSLQVWFASFAASVFMGFEPLAPIFILHACSQLEVAKNKIDNIYSQVPCDAEHTNEKLKEIIILLQDVSKLLKMINKMNVLLYDVNIKLTVVGMPLVAFQVIEAFKRYSINMEFISFLVGCVVHMFIPCYYSDLLMEKGEAVRLAIYQCGWERVPDLRGRKVLLLMLMRAQRPSVIHTMFTVINLDAFAEAIRQAFTIFSLLNAVNA